MQALDGGEVSLAQKSLSETLNFDPRELAFGTSGRRGRVADLTQLEVYINALGELEYLKSLKPEAGGIAEGQEFFFAYDLRPSSTKFVAEEDSRGEIAQAVLRAIEDAGLRAVNCGAVPTPALAFHALARQRGSMMVTGSHIPFDRNGYKTYSSTGELLKEQEAPIAEFVRGVRARVYGQRAEESLFNERGMFKAGHMELPEADASARAEYVARYVNFFAPGALAGMRLLVYQHSAVGRDLLVELLGALGAEVHAFGRSDEFIPIDTENIDAERLRIIQTLAQAAVAEHGKADAIVSVDGDSDRPLLLGIECDGMTARFIPGDLLGMVAAEFLGADAVVVPVSCNDAIDRGGLAPVVQAKTKIGSPYVITGMQKAAAAGKKRVCGWEANGGFLLGSKVERDGRWLAELMTRDAVLPLLAALLRARESGQSVCAVFDQLPKRFGRSGLLKEFPRPTALAIVAKYSPSGMKAEEFTFGDGVTARDATRGTMRLSENAAQEILEIRQRLGEYFPARDGFGRIAKLTYTDGIRINFENGDVAHLRPSGNADELRIYALANTRERAEEIVARAIAEPDGTLRRIAQSVTS